MNNKATAAAKQNTNLASLIRSVAQEKGMPINDTEIKLAIKRLSIDPATGGKKEVSYYDIKQYFCI